VLVVGIGNSAMDVACDLAPQCTQHPVRMRACTHTTMQVLLSTHRGSWIWPRAGPDGVPNDIYWATRFWSYLQTSAPLWVSSLYAHLSHFAGIVAHDGIVFESSNQS
jgi:cation diffusion facilitator CzcD-associated flavoprotein CzcO